MDLILHIGTHKTGSTALQNALRHYDDGKTSYANLEGPGGLGRTNHGIPILTCFKENPFTYNVLLKRGYSYSEITSLRNEWLEKLASLSHLPKDRRIIISGEEISTLSKVEIDDLLVHLASLFDSITVICYLRDPLSFAKSAFQQRVKAGMTQLPSEIGPRAQASLKHLSQSPIVTELKIRKYNEVVAKGGVVDDFCKTFDLEPHTSESRHVNQSLSPDALRILYRLNELCPPNSERWNFANRQTFIRHLRELRVEGEREYPDRLFACLASPSWSKFVIDHFGIDFDPLPAVRPRDELTTWLTDTSAIKSFLQNQGLPSAVVAKGNDAMILHFYNNVVSLKRNKTTTTDTFS